MTNERTCKHLRTGLPRSSRTLAHVTIKSVDGTGPEDLLDRRWALCAMCAGFFFEALRAAEQRGAVPVPIDKANTEGLV